MVPDIVTAGGPTVALRAPNHPVARLLLERTGFPLAAPSANRSEEISPTTAQHVLQSLGSQIELILDAGPTLHGIESTVIDLTDTPRILRPGPISSHQIEQIIGPLAPPVLLATITDIRSPGQLSRHYAPKTKLILTDTPLAIIRSMTQSCQRIVWIALEGETTSKDAVVITLPNDPAGYRHHLYAALHQADQAAGDLIIVTRPPIGPDWDAIHDRLQRAASSIS
jgi:L-threonylcarbamoyladenylate synthase